MIVLGIESSCDEMAAAVVAAPGRLLSSEIHDQNQVHAPYGGVVPELASRDHVRAISDVVGRALQEAGVEERELSAVAVTAGPGLIGSLLVGLSFGKALAYRLSIPHVGVHHLAAHLASAELADPELVAPYLGLVVSGGHTALYRIEAEDEPALLGQTRDDAVGEAFDKVAKLLGLPYPGGPALSKAAESGNARALEFPRPLESDPGLDFSYSGLKTAVALEVEARGELTQSDVADIAASFQVAAIGVLVTKARRAMEREGLSRLAVVGGVAANRYLRDEIARASEQDGFRAVFPPSELCTDNAAMVAAAGLRLLSAGEKHGLDLNAFSRAPLEAVPWLATRR